MALILPTSRQRGSAHRGPSRTPPQPLPASKEGAFVDSMVLRLFRDTARLVNKARLSLCLRPLRPPVTLPLMSGEGPGMGVLLRPPASLLPPQFVGKGKHPGRGAGGEGQGGPSNRRQRTLKPPSPRHLLQRTVIQPIRTCSFAVSNLPASKTGARGRASSEIRS